MYKFFLPILLFLIGLWVYFGFYQNIQKNQEEEALKLISIYENYAQAIDSISNLPSYSGFSNVTEKGISLFVPSYLSTTKDLSETASLQYKNGKKEFYIVLYDEPVGDYYSTLKEYATASLDGIKSIVTEFEISDSLYVKSENSTVFKYNVLGNFNNGQDILPIKYSILIAEYNGRYYDLTIWTTLEYLQNNQTDINKIISAVNFVPDINKAKEKLF